MRSLNGKIALVTGASSGIGEATARRFSEEGARVFIVARRQEALEAVAASLGDGVEGIVADITVDEDLDRLFAIIKDKAGQLDIVVANAGMSEHATLEETTPEHIEAMFGLNSHAPLFTVQRALPFMLQGGSIVLVGSIATRLGTPGNGSYAASKATVRSYTRTWAKELAGRGIRVNTVTPGGTDTAMFAAASDDDRRKVTDNIPLARLGRPEELASAIWFLASDHSSYVTGTELVVDGGVTLA